MVVPGDGEGGIEMTGSMQLIREFCDRFVSPEKTTRTRIVCILDLLLSLSFFINVDRKNHKVFYDDFTSKKFYSK
jgi:hypothetical protein